MKPMTLTLLIGATVMACAGKRVLVPARVDLSPRVPIGLVTFTTENAEGSIRDLATQRFAEYVLEAQPGIELLELGALPERVDASAARRLGDLHGVRAVFAGHVTVSDVRPTVSIAGGFRAEAEATVSIAVRLLSTESGGLVWTQSARTRETIASLRILDGGVVFAADDPNEAYGELVNRLVFHLTQDFRPTWRRQ